MTRDYPKTEYSIIDLPKDLQRLLAYYEKKKSVNPKERCILNKYWILQQKMNELKWAEWEMQIALDSLATIDTWQDNKFITEVATIPEI